MVDLDGDGVIRPHEMRLFYNEQLHRMECLGHELVPFDDMFTQMCDMVGLKPEKGFEEFHLSDFVHGGARAGP